MVRAVVTPRDLIVSCADCSSPSVKFYNHDLELIHTMDVDKNVHSAYELAAHDQPDLQSL